ncbi:1,4-alpha-glucan branching protein GlgB [Mariniblastus fucicola]|uniref:1,4-alpha-glucan branching enzyme GlgB n=1 Tax=Mariniblastus fucicola TaxID=980251 RepID=A0A5B9P8J6_9BACT|nr:1,4-alpha-glucan branching protein GlgB [Mariniblastus fucicola]QEG22608.1 1,4-alpha-glucan branching enzyme GlgB [Mariniblastus fucicola]
MPALDIGAFKNIIDGKHTNPNAILGPIRLDGPRTREKIRENPHHTTTIRAFLPDADKAWISTESGTVTQQMQPISQCGLFEVSCETDLFQVDSGRYKIQFSDGKQKMSIHDPYAFEPLLSDLDLHLFNEGTHFKIYERLGAHPREIDGIHGINFAVWAPNAQGVSVIGDFNEWDGRRHAMRKQIPSGIWEIFVPELGVDEVYKFRVTDCHGTQVEKSDPFGYFAEVPPKTASIVKDLSGYQWNDDDWMKQRAESNQLEKPISVYEIHPGSWKTKNGQPNGWMNYRDLAHDLVEYCLELGFTHVELMPITEHPYTGSWGYQTVGYFAPTSRYGDTDDFMYFVDYLHQNGLGVIVDWVPAHFPKDGHGLAKFDGTALFEHADPRQGEHPDWDTLIFNYKRTEVSNFLIANAMFWLEKYHIDGLRVDAVASMLYLDYSRKDGEWVPNEYGGRENLGAIDFLKRLNTHVHEDFPGVLTIAEESTAFGGVSRPVKDGGLGFSIKWNMGWMNDSLRYFQKEPIHRKYHHDELTFSLIYAFSENFMLPFSHDEVVHGKGALLDQMPGDIWQKFANLRLLYSYMWAHPGKKLMFMGCEWGQWNEWSCDSGLQWDLLQWESHEGVQRMVGDLNRLYREQPALYELDFDGNGFEWIDCMNRDASVLAWMRKAKDPNDFVIVCGNFTPYVHSNYRVGVPGPGIYKSIFNSDSKFYSGTNVGVGEVVAEEVEAQGKSWSIAIDFPPLATVMYKRD